MLIQSTTVIALLSLAQAGTDTGGASITRGVEDPAVLVESIFAKLSYDSAYFDRVLRAESAGRRPPGVSAEQFQRDVRRSTALKPVLSKILSGKDKYQTGQPLPAPGRGSRTRVYDNLVGLLNMIQAREQKKPRLVLALGERINVTDVRDLGLRIKGEPTFRLRLLREYFYLMAGSSFRVGNDAAANRWNRQILEDPRLSALREASGQTKLSPEEMRERRTQRLRLSAIAVKPLEQLAGPKDMEWLGQGLMEVLVADLSRLTDLTIVERAQLDKLVDEYNFRYFRDDGENNDIENLRDILDAGSLFVGSYANDGDHLQLQVRLIDTADGLILGAAQAKSARDDVFDITRRLLLEVLGRIDWVEPLAAAEVMESKPPNADALRDLVKARSLVTTEAAEARRLYEKAMQTDPRAGSMFAQLKEEFPDVKALTALAPFENISGQKDDEWIIGAINQALHGDLPKGGLDLIDRDLTARAIEMGQTITATTATMLAGALDAHFVIVGGLAREGTTLRLDARMIAVQTGEILFARDAKGDAGNVGRIIEALTAEMLTASGQHLSEDVMQNLMGRRLSNSELKTLGQADERNRNELAKPLTGAKEEKFIPVRSKPRGPRARRKRIAVAGGIIGVAPAVQLRLRFVGLSFRPLSTEITAAIRDLQDGGSFRDIRASYRMAYGTRFLDLLYVDGTLGVGLQIENKDRSFLAVTIPGSVEFGLSGKYLHAGIEVGAEYLVTHRVDFVSMLALGATFY